MMVLGKKTIQKQKGMNFIFAFGMKTNVHYGSANDSPPLAEPPET
jgi:hypothetical protein